ncbi:MAG: pyruvate dehydrogenase (acetyl-transferring) E1 component subunit alpha [Planctomycetota bacterium]|nr:MAG: pyruvate dehydrogenase (acetyl-transferring) E1 component subunit alpha [Planctomycetota bacterium]
MPRKPIKIKPKVTYLSILDEKGNVDTALEPKLDADKLLHLYRLMLTARRLDERCLNLQRQGRIGTYGPCRGQEACHCPATMAMDPEDWIVHSFREPGSFHHRGWPLETVIKFWGGYEEGCVPPEGVNDLPIAVPIATQFPHAMGIAWAMKLRGDPHAVLCYGGDGSTSEGDFHEAMNFAGVYRLPVIFLIQNNQWAISIPRERQTASETLAQKAIAYGFDGIQVDGNDALAVYVATRECAEKAKSGGGPSLIEAVTYRLSVHTTADDPTKYRDEEEVKKWEKRDPIPRFQKYLKKKGILDDKLTEEIEKDVLADVAAAVDRYEASREVDPLDAFDSMYAELPAELRAQREEFKKALEEEGWYDKGH